MKQGKVWGETSKLLANPFVEAHWIEVEPKSHCSIHHHEHRWNAFIVIAGELFVDVYQREYNLVDETRLIAGEIMSVPPGIDHRFRTGGLSAAVLEIYWPETLGGPDIVRRDVGGKL
jgi:mannose-6-phosphate isomerase-like protein (cupin superfamily)